MITKATLEVQLQIYQGIHARAINELEQAKVNLAASQGAVETCRNFLRLSDELEATIEKKNEEAEDA